MQKAVLADGMIRLHSFAIVAATACAALLGPRQVPGCWWTQQRGPLLAPLEPLDCSYRIHWKCFVRDPAAGRPPSRRVFTTIGQIAALQVATTNRHMHAAILNCMFGCGACKTSCPVIHATGDARVSVAGWLTPPRAGMYTPYVMVWFIHAFMLFNGSCTAPQLP
jgi:hypothetical protein